MCKGLLALARLWEGSEGNVGPPRSTLFSPQFPHFKWGSLNLAFHPRVPDWLTLSPTPLLAWKRVHLMLLERLPSKG